MKSKLLLIILVVVFSNGKNLSAQCTDLLWADEFSGEVLDTLKWNIEIDGEGGGNNELQFYTQRDTNVSVSDGTLKITALAEKYDENNYTSGKIFSKYKGDWKYGRIEARIKLPEGQGIWPAFWMMPTESKYGTWPNSGEIDIMELVGGESGDSTVWGTLHVGPPWNFTNGSYTLENEKFSDSFHVFAIEWTADSIKWFVDDILYSVKTSEDVSHWAPFQERFYVILNLAVGGNWPGAPDETTVFPQVMEVDYVRVYGKPENQGIIAIDSVYPNAEKATYSFTQVPGATFQWSVDADGAQINGAANESKVDILWGCLPGNVNLEVNYPDCGVHQYSLPVEFSKPVIKGNFELLQGEESMFSVPRLNETSYTWTIPNDAEILGETDTNQVLVKWGCNAGSIQVDINNSCNFMQVSQTISILSPVMQGPSTVVANSKGVRYSLTELPDASYEWFVPEGASIAQGQGTSKVSIDFTDNEGQVKVVYTNNCGIDSMQLWVKITDTIVLCDFETSFVEFEGWDDGVELEVIPNPLIDEVNNSGSVGKSFKAESPWSGTYGDLGYNMDLSMHNRFSVKVLGPKAGAFLFKIEDVGEGIEPSFEDKGEVPPIEVSGNYTMPGEWQNLVFDFTKAPSGVFDRITLFYDFGMEDTSTFYFDDIILLPSDTVFIQQNNPNEIVEGAEDGNEIIVKIWYDKLNETLNSANWTFANLPEGVEVADINRVTADTVILTLSGNTTTDYDVDIKNFTTEIEASELYKSASNLMTDKGVVFTAIIEDGVSFYSESELSIMPNPAQNYCIIKAKDNIDNITLYNLNGQKVYLLSHLNSKNVKLNLNELQNGVYMALIKMSNGNFSLKQIIKNNN